MMTAAQVVRAKELYRATAGMQGRGISFIQNTLRGLPLKCYQPQVRGSCAGQQGQALKGRKLSRPHVSRMKRTLRGLRLGATSRRWGELSC